MNNYRSKTIGLILIGLSLSLKLSAQEAIQKTSLQFYGFIRNEFYFDTYKGVDAAMDQFYLVPLYTGKDDNGKDFNNQGSAHLTAIASRIGMNITGPSILGAASSANIEYDFAGVTTSEPVLIRIRKAFFKLNWEKSALLVGQNWHPFWGGNVFPTVASLNTGAPFQPFNRSPQVNYDYHINKLTLSATALYENQYVSKGFYVCSNSNQQTLPKRNAVIPELVIGAKYVNDNIAIGVAAQHNTIKPIDRTTGTAGTFVTNEMNFSSAAMAYLKYKSGKLSVLAKTVYGQNLANLTLLGGYGVKSIDETTGAFTYTNYNNYTAFVNAVYGKKYQVGVFAGIGENLGTTDALALTNEGKTKTAGMLTNIQNIKRISAHLAYNVDKFRFVAEYELTNAMYGIGDITLSNGLYDATESVSNNRLLFMMMYFF
ncbi:MAG: hypothetical protein ACERKD_05095 [Prolixibacteraceae bacterium]